MTSSLSFLFYNKHTLTALGHTLYDDVLNDCNQAAVDRLNKEKRTRFFLSDIHDWGKTGNIAR